MLSSTRRGKFFISVIAHVSSLQTSACIGNQREDPAELHGCSFPGSERARGQRSTLDTVMQRWSFSTVEGGEWASG